MMNLFHHPMIITRKRKSQAKRMKNIKLGQAGEAFAAAFLKSAGYTILYRNYRSGHLETDIICENSTHILFVEVKSRTDTGKPSKYGRPGTAAGRDRGRQGSAGPLSAPAQRQAGEVRGHPAFEHDGKSF